MVVLVDEPRWPAHGRLWAHLVSDSSLTELHAFARARGVPARGFDADHYDVPEQLVPDLVAAGAEQVTPRELLVRLQTAGLRVRQRDKPPRGAGHPGPAGTAGLLLAAGPGTRSGGPGALARHADGTPELARRVAALRAGGCDPVLVVLGAAADEARALLPAGTVPVVATDWERGMSASLQAGLRVVAALEPAPAAVLVALLGAPTLTGEGARRVLATGSGQDALARAAYAGRAGHPVLLGRRHWSAVAAAATADRGAGPYLKAAGAVLVECADLVGTPPTLVG